LVAGSIPAGPRTCDVSSEDFQIHEMLEVLLGSEGKRKIRLHRKTNSELFELYDAQLILRHRSKEALTEAKRVLNHFREYLGEYPPSPELAASFLAQFANNKTTTLYRYHSIVKTFMEWYGEKLDSKIRLPQTLPDYVNVDEIEKLKTAIRSHKTHKKVIERNLLIIELARKTGLRRQEIGNLTVKDINFQRGFIQVHGKGGKDRIIEMAEPLQESLAAFTKGVQPEAKVFGIAPSTISGLIRWAAVKGGANLHTHSLRHFFGQSLVDTGTDLETVRRLMGHSSLRTTQIYIGRTDKQRRDAINRLEGIPPDEIIDERESKQFTEKDSKLQLRIREVNLIGTVKETYFVLLRLVFVNPSSTGRTVYHVGSGAPKKDNVGNPIMEIAEDSSKIKVIFTMNKKINIEIKQKELLMLPFDIPAYQSRVFWLPLEIEKKAIDKVFEL